MMTTRVFNNGNGQALRVPQELRTNQADAASIKSVRSSSPIQRKTAGAGSQGDRHFLRWLYLKENPALAGLRSGAGGILMH